VSKASTSLVSLKFSYILSGPNRIPERQRVFQASDNMFRSTSRYLPQRQAATHLPVYRRGKYSNILLSNYYLLLSCLPWLTHVTGLYTVSMVAGVATTAGGIYALIFVRNSVYIITDCVIDYRIHDRPNPERKSDVAYCRLDAASAMHSDILYCSSNRAKS